MFGKFRKHKVETVKPMGYVEYESEKGKYKGYAAEEGGYATRLDVAVGAGLSAVSGIGFVAYHELQKVEQISAGVEQISAVGGGIVPVTSTVGSGIDTVGTVPVNWVVDSGLAGVATVLDPLIDILVAFSFPIASVIMVGACFFFMLGQNERAWNTIFNAGLGYILIQLAPTLLEILKNVGSVVG